MSPENVNIDQLTDKLDSQGEIGQYAELVTGENTDAKKV